MRPKLNNLVLWAAALLTAGCSSFGPAADRARYVLTLHEPVNPNAPSGPSTARLASDTGDTVRVRIRPLLSSANVAEASATTDAEGKPVLLATLDHHGRMMWLQVCGDHAGARLAVVVDGIYRFDMTIPSPEGAGDSLRITGPWDQKELESVAAWAPKNYELLNKK